MDGQVIFRHGVEHQGVGDPGLIQGVDGLQDWLSGVTLDELVGQIGSGGLAFRIEQIDLGRGPVDGLVDDDVQHLAEAVRTGGVEVSPHALERVLVLLFQSDADDEGLDDDALRLEGPGNRAGVFVTGLDAVGDEQDDVAPGALLVGEIVGCTEQGAGDGGGALGPEFLEFLLDEQVASLADGHHELGVVAVLLTGHMLGAMPVDPESDFQALDAV